MEYWFNIGMYRFYIYIGKTCGTNEPISHSFILPEPSIPLFHYSNIPNVI